MYSLEQIIHNKTVSNIKLCEDINKILSREWMGDIEKKDSPLYNIKKNYGYDKTVIAASIRNGGKLLETAFWKILQDGYWEH